MDYTGGEHFFFRFCRTLFRDCQCCVTAVPPLEQFVGMEAFKRRSFFNSLDNCKRFTFNPDHLYTFVFFQDLIDGFNFQLQVTGITIYLI